MSGSGQTHDLIVIGGGPAGASAAITVADAGLHVVLVDEGVAAGGQVYRPPVSGHGDDLDGDGGYALRARLAASKVESRFGTRVWHVEHGFRVSALGPDGPVSMHAPRLIVAVGAMERHRPIPGWTLPGVYGLAGATNLLKSQKMLPGHRVAVAGSGPLLYLVAASILAAGGGLAVVVDARKRRDWLGEAASLMLRPDLASRGAAWLTRIKRCGTPVLYGHALSEIHGVSAVEGVLATALASTGRGSSGPGRQFACDAVCYGFGLLPQTEATRLLGVRHIFDDATVSWLPQSDVDGATDVSGLYVCGDGAGVSGAAYAALQGEITGLAVARAAVGDLSWAQQARRARLLQSLGRARRFGAAMSRLSMPPPGAVA